MNGRWLRRYNIITSLIIPIFRVLRYTYICTRIVRPLAAALRCNIKSRVPLPPNSFAVNNVQFSPPLFSPHFGFSCIPGGSMSFGTPFTPSFFSFSSNFCLLNSITLLCLKYVTCLLAYSHSHVSQMLYNFNPILRKPQVLLSSPLPALFPRPPPSSRLRKIPM